MTFSRARFGRPGGASVVPRPGTRAWLRIWYRVICALPASMGCDATLVLNRASDVDADGYVLHGMFQWLDETRSRITCTLDRDVIESVGTLVHEVAHFAQNQRHAKAHGYSWRRAVRAICADLTGTDPLALATEIRRQHKFSRREALDTAVYHLLLNGQIGLVRHPAGGFEAFAGKRTHRVW